MKTNFEKYLSLHNELMKRCQNNEITTENTKECIDMAFDKYIINDSINVMTESVRDILDNIRNKIYMFKIKDLSYESVKIDYNKLDNDVKEKITKYKSLLKSSDSIVKKVIENSKKECDDENIKSKLSSIVFNPTESIYCYKVYKKDKVKQFEIYINRSYASTKSTELEYSKLVEYITELNNKDLYSKDVVKNKLIPYSIWDDETNKIEIVAGECVARIKPKDME